MIDRFDHLFIAPTDYEKTLAFYRDVLGWSVTSEWGSAGEGRGSVLSGGAMKVVIAEKKPHGPAGDDGLGDGRPNVHLDIHDLDARFKALPPGTHVVRPPEKTHWGTRWFVVKDPDGNLIAFEELHSRGG